MKVLKKAILGFVALTAMLSSCNSDDQGNQASGPSDKKTITFFGTSATDESLSKLYLANSDGSVYFSQGDEISVFDGTYNNKFSALQAGASSDFKGSAKSVDTYYMLCPYQESASYTGGRITAMVSESQRAIDGTFDPAACLSVATCPDGKSFVLQNIGAIIRINTVSPFQKIRLVSISGEPLTGSVSINPDDASLEILTGKSYAELRVPGGIVEPGVYYFSVLPGVMKEGLRVEFYSNDDDVLTKTFAKEITIARGKGLNCGKVSEYDEGEFEGTYYPEESPVADEFPGPNKVDGGPYKLQVLDEATDKSMRAFGDQLYEKYFSGTSTGMSKAFTVIENPDLDYLPSESVQDPNGKYIVDPCNLEGFPTRGYTKYNSWIKTVTVLHADKTLDVYLYPTAGYFKDGGYMFVKLGAVNNGNSFGNECVHYKVNDKYVYFRLNLDEFADGNPSEQESRLYGQSNCKGKYAITKLFPLGDFGYVNVIPLLLSDNGNRYYTHPIHIHTSSYWDKSITCASNHTHNNHPDYGKVLGTADGVRVICDGAGNGLCNGCGWQRFQCSEFVSRYLNLVTSGQDISFLNANMMHTLSNIEKWGCDNYGYINQAPQESDMLEWTSGNYGHVVIVSKVDYKNQTFWYTGQNASKDANGNLCTPIMQKAYFELSNGKYKLYRNASKKGIFNYIIRKAESAKQTTAAVIDAMNLGYSNMPTVAPTTPTTPSTPSTPDPEPDPEPEITAPTISYSITGNTRLAPGENLAVNIVTDQNCNIYVYVDGTRVDYDTDIKRFNCTLPTDEVGNHNVSIKASAGGLSSERTFEFNVEEPEEVFPEIEYTLYPSGTIYRDDNCYVKIYTDMNCKIRVYVDDELHDSKTGVDYFKCYLPTDAIGTYDVRIKATNDDGNSTQEEFSYRVKRETVVEPEVHDFFNCASDYPVGKCQIGGHLYNMRPNMYGSVYPVASYCDGVVTVTKNDGSAFTQPGTDIVIKCNEAVPGFYDSQITSSMIIGQGSHRASTDYSSRINVGTLETRTRYYVVTYSSYIDKYGNTIYDAYYIGPLILY